MVWNGTVRRKRIITMPAGSPFGAEIDVGGVQNIREFVNFWSYGAWEVAKRAIKEANDLVKLYPPQQSLRDLVVNRMWGIVNKLVTYQYDKYYVDYWNEASETVTDKWGDCEDSSILLTSALRSQGFDGKMAVGYYIDPNTREWYGHAFVLYPVEMMQAKIAVLETTWEDYVNPNMWILLEGSHYHVTAEGNDIGFEQKCFCQNCQDMINYFETGKALTKMKITKTEQFRVLTATHNALIQTMLSEEKKNTL